MTTLSRETARTLRALLLAGTTGLLLTACDTPVQVHGHMPDKDAVARIEAGVHSRDDVPNLLGSPSAVSTFEDKTWYYVGSKSKQFAFFEREVLERSVLVVSFGAGETVEATKVYTLEDGRAVDPVDRVTPTEGKDLTILQQLLGNVGRFNPESDGFDTAVPSPTGPGT